MELICILKVLFYTDDKLHIIYNLDDSISGSTKLFTALLDRCLKKEVYALCRLVSRSKTSPRLVALIPLHEKFDEKKQQVVPPGFFVFPLPFSDDIRDITALSNTENAVEVDDTQIEKAKKIVLSMTQHYKPRLNPILQQTYKVIEAVALTKNIDEEDIKKDDTLPSDEIPHEAYKAIEDFSISMPEPFDRSAFAAGTKRSAPAESQNDILDKVENAARSGTLSKLVVADLKVYVASLNISTSNRKKAELIEIIESNRSKRQKMA